MNPPLEKGERVTTGGKGRGEIRGEAEEVIMEIHTKCKWYFDQLTIKKSRSCDFSITTKTEQRELNAGKLEFLPIHFFIIFYVAEVMK